MRNKVFTHKVKKANQCASTDNYAKPSIVTTTMWVDINHQVQSQREKPYQAKYMNKKTIICTIFILISTISFFSCKDNIDISKMLAERDSILEANKSQKQELEDLNNVLSIISVGLDSIAIQENILLTNKGNDGVILSRDQILANIDLMANLISRQRNRIQQLGDSISNLKTQTNTDGLKKLQNIINVLNLQLEQKDQVINSLRADINNKNHDINQLRSTITNMRTNVRDLNTKVEEAEKKNVVLKDALTEQDNMINECYVKIGSKKELKNLGLLTGGFLKKKKINYNEVNAAKFNRVDIRQFRQVHLNSSNPKILTPMPNNSSFHFEDEGDGTCSLVITDPTTFWSVCNYLIIQL